MAKYGKAKLGGSRKPRRREELRRSLPRRTLDLRAFVQQPEFVYAALVTLVFLVVTAALLVWSRQQLKVTDGRIMSDTRLKRLDYRVPDEQLTDQRRQRARGSAPHVYTGNALYLDRLAASLNGLPKAIAGKTALSEIAEDLRREYRLTDAALAALAPFAVDGDTTRQWRSWVRRLTHEELFSSPLISSDDYQKHWVPREYSQRLKRMLRLPSGELEQFANDTDAIELRPDASLAEDPRLELIVSRSGFPPEVVPYVAARLAINPEPAVVFSEQETEAEANSAAEAVATVFTEHRKGEVLYRRGDVLTTRQLEELRHEQEEFDAKASLAERWLPRLGAIGFAALAACFLIGYVVLFYPRIARNPVRLMAIAGLMAVMLAMTAVVGVRSPGLLYLAAVAPTIFVAMVALLAYDQRIALFISATQCALATLALEQSVGMVVLLFAGCGTAIAQLREMRHRSTLIKASAVTGLVLATGSVLLGLLETPMVSGAWLQIIKQTAYAGLGGLGVGFIVQNILPTLERWFDITTGMTLAELRDPKQPLLRQLQQKAPGTYNHSLQVANIAEAAAETIGANGLLVYVGALYHDIGKMNKPEYFVENQTEGASKHAKLSPAMSLLVIVGHVKDGIELAREYGLPRTILHFIESHHGTTLVEYFYHAAKSQAESDDRSSVEEIEFRYPGPRPRTKEAAILMLADAVESATRSLADPQPARIENLVRQLSRKRLADAQYDQCDLTFRELSLIEESVIKSLCAIYHGRISYPSQKQLEGEPAETSVKPMSA